MPATRPRSRRCTPETDGSSAAERRRRTNPLRWSDVVAGDVSDEVDTSYSIGTVIHPDLSWSVVYANRNRAGVGDRRAVGGPVDRRVAGPIDVAGIDRHVAATAGGIGSGQV